MRKTTINGLAGLIAGLFSEHVETLMLRLRRRWLRLSGAWFGILSLGVLLTWGVLLMNSGALVPADAWLALKVAATLFLVALVALPTVFWGFLWAARIVFFCAFALRFLVRPLK
jgi:hypothetical protein